MENQTQSTESRLKDKAVWHKHYQQYKQSGLSKTVYSQQHNLVLHQFMYWSRKFDDAAIQQNIKTENTFLPVKIKPTLDSNAGNVLCSLELSENKRLLIHDLSALRFILNSLGVI